MRIALAAAILALAACQPQAPAAEAPNTRQAALPAEPALAPAPRPVIFTPISREAEALTGRIALSPLPRPGAGVPPQMKIESATGLLYTTELLPGGAEQARNVDWKSVFGAEIVSAANPPPGAPSIDLHIVGGETIPDTLNSGGFCGEDPTHAIAMATGLVIEGRDQAILAAFKGATWPPVNASDLCGTFSYVPPARE